MNFNTDDLPVTQSQWTADKKATRQALTQQLAGRYFGRTGAQYTLLCVSNQFSTGMREKVKIGQTDQQVRRAQLQYMRVSQSTALVSEGCIFDCGVTWVSRPHRICCHAASE